MLRLECSAFDGCAFMFIETREREKEHRMIRCIHITIKWHRRLIVFQYSLVTQLMENFPHKLLHYFTVSGFPLHTLWRSVYLSLLFKCIKLMTLQRKITTYFRYALSLPLHSDLDCCCCCCVCVCVSGFSLRQ